MGTEIYYFSGTGNSLRVARELQARLPRARLMPVLSLVDRDIVKSNAETVGFVFPHYASSLPKVMHSFIERLDPGSARYLFAIATRGGTKTMAFEEIDRILAKKGRRLDLSVAITMPAGSEPLSKAYPNRITVERMRRLEAQMLERLATIQTNILERATSREADEGDTAPPPRLLVPFLPLIRAVSPLLVPLGKRVESSFEFYYDEKCTGCGVCEQVCLAEKVRMVDGRPVWEKAIKCHGCFACLNFCPQESIQVKSKWYLKSYTEQNGRYHHPEITARDIAAQKSPRTS
jgi:NAD-dependent dihydropyrimidine dehydrogenase PreA subunit